MVTEFTNLNGVVSQALTGEALRARLAKARPVLAVPVPELDDNDAWDAAPTVVHIQRLSGPRRRELSRMQTAGQEWEPNQEIREQRERVEGYDGLFKRSEMNKRALVYLSYVEPLSGRLQWTEEDVQAIEDSNPAAFDWLHAVATCLNGLPRGGLADHYVRRAESLNLTGPSVQPMSERLGNSPSGPGNSSS